MGSVIPTLCGSCTVNIQEMGDDVKELKKDMKFLRENHIHHLSLDVAVIKRDVEYIKDALIGLP